MHLLTSMHVVRKFHKNETLLRKMTLQHGIGASVTCMRLHGKVDVFIDYAVGRNIAYGRIDTGLHPDHCCFDNSRVFAAPIPHAECDSGIGIGGEVLVTSGHAVQGWALWTRNGGQLCLLGELGAGKRSCRNNSIKTVADLGD